MQLYHNNICTGAVCIILCVTCEVTLFLLIREGKICDQIITVPKLLELDIRDSTLQFIVPYIYLSMALHQIV